ncbi:Mov34/MPN/PAD-1 family protein [Lacipirellula sp.]|uniref:Mov34/MPN/PAD-1 family protein n=1 Tax=Lacipirellula sp. TaxID=2691419 RepID=UPI003D0C685B
MSTTDVSNLASEGLAEIRFPVDYHAPFRFYLAPEVHRGVNAHAKEDTSVEICGVLVGVWGRDELGPFAQVSNFIRCDNASSKVAEVTFTHESWAQINQEMDSKYADKRIVGWYHSHPDFGIFLSDRDCFIHEHFFSGAGQVAYVVDPVRDLEGVFAWQKGKPTPLAHYWIGSEVCTVEASQRNVAREQGAPASRGAVAYGEASTAVFPSSGSQPSLGTATTMLGWIGVFLLGYLLASTRDRSEQQTLMEGLLSHYSVNKVMNIGLENDLTLLRKNAQSIALAAQKLPQPTDKLSEEEAVVAAKQLKSLNDSLMFTEKMLERVEERYTLTDDEKATALRLIQQQHQALVEARPPQDATGKNPTASGAGGTAPAVPAPKKEATAPVATPAPAAESPSKNTPAPASGAETKSP